MPYKASELIHQMSLLQTGVWSSTASALSEFTGAQVTVRESNAISMDLSDLVSLEPQESLVLQFSFAHKPDSIQTLLLNENAMAGFFMAIQGGFIGAFTEEMVSDAKGFFEALIQGICSGATSFRGEKTLAGAFTTKLRAFTTPDNIVQASTILRSTVQLGLGTANLDIHWLTDDETMVSLMPSKARDEAAYTAQAKASDVGVSGTPPEDASLRLLFDIPLEISVELGRVKMVVRDVLELGAGSIVEIDKAAGEPVDVLVNGRPVARGEVVVIEDNFGVRITEILNPAERLAKLNEAA